MLTTCYLAVTAVAALSWWSDDGLSFLGYVHLLGDLMSFCFCVGLAAAVHWARLKMDVQLPPVAQALLYSAKAFFILLGVGAGLDFGLLLWPGHGAWIAVEVLLKLAMSFAAGLTFALVVYMLPRFRTVHAGLYMRRLAEELKRSRESTPPQ